MMQVDYEVETRKDTPYRINVGDEIKVHRFDLAKDGKIIPLYWTVVTKNEYGKKAFYRKTLKFKKDVNVKDGSVIRINDMFEDAIKNHKDAYNPIWCLVIIDYEVLEEKDNNDTRAMIDYQQNISENKDNSIYDDLIVF